MSARSARRPRQSAAIPAAPILVAGALLLVACRSSGPSFADRDRIDYKVSHGQYVEALQDAARLAAEHPDDPAAVALHRQTSVALLLEQGRRATLDDRDEEALAKFTQALEIDPHSSQVRHWIQKTNIKLALVWYERARALHVDDKLVGALEGYERALAYDPTLQYAREGALRVVIQINYRDGLSEDYYNEGVRAMNDYRLYIAKSRFIYAGKYRDPNVKPKRRVRETDVQLAEARASIALRLEADGRFTAARNEFKGVLLLDPDNEEGAAGLARTEVEAEATRLLHDGRMMVLRREWKRGQAMLEEGQAMTERQHEAFDTALTDIDDARALATYETALALEHDFRYPDAIVEYGRLLEMREWYEDARARMSTLQGYVEQAAQLYTRAAAETDEERLSTLRQIEIVWPEYEDVRELIEALEKETAEKKENG